MKNRSVFLLFLALTFSVYSVQFSSASSNIDKYSVHFVDSMGHRITIATPPQRVVSLVPAITEMLVKLGAADRLVGVTSSATPTPTVNQKALVGSFLHPDVARIYALAPDIIFFSDLQLELLENYEGPAQRIFLKQNSIEQGFRHLKILGEMFNKRGRAQSLVGEQKKQIQVILKKTSTIRDEEKLRTLRFMGSTGGQVTVPGDDSFQNEFIVAAGGLAPHFGQRGDVIPITLQQWQEFNPQVIYGCGNRETLLVSLSKEGWRDVIAVQNKQVLTFPCEITCRAASNMGGFIATLSARLYRDYFSDPQNLVVKEQVLRRSPLNVSLAYVEKAEKIETSISDFINKTLLLSFTRPMTILSSLEGWRNNISYVGNHYLPPPSWGLGLKQGVTFLKEHTLKVLGLENSATALLFTGADMDNLAIVEKVYEDMRVIAMVTAGVSGNAVRMSADSGDYYELAGRAKAKKPGTINILLLTNTKLSPRAMTRAIISATEAKTAALYDLDIRSSYTPTTNPATGTGTDNIIVVQGQGPPIDSSGGHTKMGELIAKAVYQGVLEAIGKQNGFTAARSVFCRLKERKIDISTVAKLFSTAENYSSELYKLLLQPKYSGFIEEAMVLGDAMERGLIADNASFLAHCQTTAAEVAGRETSVKPIESTLLSPALGHAFGALLSGLEMREM